MMHKKIRIIIISVLIIITTYLELYAQDAGGVIGTDLVNRMAVLAFQLSIIIFAAWLGGNIFERFHMPAVLGEIIAGVIIGPYLLGSISLPGFTQGLFPLQGNFPVSNELYSFTAIASIVLLFLVGVETNIETFITFYKAGFFVGLGGVIVSFFMGDLAGVLCSRYVFGTAYSFGHPVPLFLGLISSATSVGITARMLSEKRKMDSPEGVTILSGAVIDDVLGIIALAIIMGIIKSGHVAWKQIAFISFKAFAIWLGFTIAGLVFSQHLSKLLKKIKDKKTISIISFAMALFLAGIFEKSGLAMIIGAYVMGLSFSKTDLSFTIMENLSPMYRFFVPVFFCVMGMLVNIREMASWSIVIFGMLYVVFAVVGKLLGCGVTALFLNFNLRGALRIGVGMIPRGEVALIIAGIGLATGILHHQAFAMAIMMTFITTLITPPILAKMLDSEAPVLRKDIVNKREHKQIVYNMPNAETAELVLNKVITTFKNEGFFIYMVEIPYKLFQIRKNEIFITLKFVSQELVFECQSQNAPFIHTLFYEIIAELEHTMKSLQMLADKEKIGKEIFSKENDIGRIKLELDKFISPLAVKIQLKGTTKLEIIEELVDLFVKSGQLDMSIRQQALNDLLEREKTMSTGMQYGIALPHAKTSAVDNIISAIALKKEGVDFVSLDKKLSTIFVITLIPTSSQQPYLEYMAKVSKFLLNESNRKKILSSKTNTELYSVISSVSS